MRKPKAKPTGCVGVRVRVLDGVAQSDTLINDMIRSIFDIHQGIECTKEQASEYVAALFSGKEEATRIYFLTDDARKVLAYAVVEQHIIPANKSPCYYVMYLDSFESGNNYAGRLLSRLPGILQCRKVVHKDAKLCDVEKITKINTIYLNTRPGLVIYYIKRNWRIISENDKTTIMLLNQ